MNRAGGVVMAWEIGSRQMAFGGDGRRGSRLIRGSIKKRGGDGWLSSAATRLSRGGGVAWRRGTGSHGLRRWATFCRRYAAKGVQHSSGVPRVVGRGLGVWSETD